MNRMKKFLLAIFVVFLTICSSGCVLKEKEYELPIEMVAFNSLNEDEKAKIPVSPKDSNVEYVVVDDHLMQIVGEEYNGKQVYSVTFNNSGENTDRNLVVYVEKDKKTVIGKET